MTKYIITKQEEKKVGQITLPNGIGLYSKNSAIEVVINCHLNPAYLNIDNILHNIVAVLSNYKPCESNNSYYIRLCKSLRIEAVPCKDNLNTTWYFYEKVEDTVKIQPNTPEETWTDMTYNSAKRRNQIYNT